MSKREHEPDNTDRPPKRPRPARTPQATQPVEHIESARQLQQLLVFRQDDTQQLRHGIASCKAFLESIVYQSDDESQPDRLVLLQGFLEGEKPRDANDTDRPFFSQLWQAWSFANSNNSDHLSSAICSLFALLLKSLSTLVDFREYGKLLCRTVLQFQHLRLIKRCLDAPKHKEFLLSPSLRLLSEVTHFDGGVFAHEIYKRREQTFDLSALRKCLAIVKSEDSEDDLKRRPAVRTVAARYVLAHLRLQDEGGKIDILKQRQLCTTLFSYFRNDPPDLILDILRTAEAQVLKIQDLPRSSKSALLTQQHLERVLDIATRAEVNEEVTREALRWLKTACSTPSYGILRASGWYPPGTMQLQERSTLNHRALDLGLDSLDFWENEDKFQLKNVILASWIRTLRPNADLRERELVLTCFNAAPELVHAYFRDNALQMEPKLTNTWIGYASFFFEVANLPVPRNTGNVDSNSYAALPPQTSVVYNSILPKPLTQKVMIRCLNQNDKLISFFVVRLLIISIEKIVRLRQDYKLATEASTHSDLWKEAGLLLEAAHLKSLPPAKDVLSLLRRLPDDEEHRLQREATSKLLSLYLSELPELASGENIDISTALVAALTLYAQDGAKDKRSAWSFLELEHLIAIAQHSGDMRWFQKQGGLPASPLITMLQLCLNEETSLQLRSLAENILVSSSILAERIDNSKTSSFDALIWSLQANQNSHVWEFLEDCLLRATKAPVKYLDDLESVDSIDSIDSIDKTSTRPDLLAAVILEQVPFVVSKSPSIKTDIMRWVNSWFAYSVKIAQASKMLKAIKSKIDATEGWDPKHGSKVSIKTSRISTQAINGEIEVDMPIPPSVSKLSLFPTPQTESQDHPELFRWQKKDLDIAFEDHDVDGLVLCLCSEYGEVRRQARSQLEQLLTKLQASDLEDKDQLALAIGELLETFDRNYQPGDLCMPYLVGTFAVHAIQIQLDPPHHMYPKLNRYMMKSPDWRVSKLTSYWLSATSMSVPSEDDSYWKEVQWVLEWIAEGLRTPADLELVRRAGSFERLMALCASPSASDKLVKQKVLEIIYRAALIDPVTLITRTGILSWLDSLKGDLPAELRSFILNNSDAERLQAWAGTTLSK